MHLVSVGRLTKEHSTEAQRAALLHSVRPDLKCWQSMQVEGMEPSVVNMTYPGSSDSSPAVMLLKLTCDLCIEYCKEVTS